MAVILTFYRNFLVPCTVFTLIHCFFLAQAGTFVFITKTWYLKILPTLGFAAYVEIFRGDQFYYFNNLGYSKTKLYTGAFAIDVTTWLLASMLVLKAHDFNL